MTYREAIEAARKVKSYEESDSLLKSIEDNDTISDTQYYNVRSVAIKSAYEAQVAEA
jgi:hypothetical protein